MLIYCDGFMVPVNHELRDPVVYSFRVVYVFLKSPNCKLSEEHDSNVLLIIPSVKCAC